jgi:uncharacterized membrane protein
MKTHLRRYFLSNLRKYFISGLLIWVPILVTILVIKFLADLLDSIFMVLPKSYQPDALVGIHLPGFGVLVILILIIVTGAVAANFLGSRLVLIWDNLIGRIPVIRSLYMGVKQVMETLFTPGGQSFRKVLLVEYPRKDMWTLAFQTGDATPEVQTLVNGEPMVSLFVPTTPNPTSGFLIMVPKKDVIELSMTVDQALKFVISLGVMQPNGQKNKSTEIGKS